MGEGCCLAGVDLSEGMLAHMKEKRVYDTLVKAEPTGISAHAARPST